MQSAGTLSTQVATRVRDPYFNGTTQTETISLLSSAQRVVNGVLWDSVGSATLTVQPRTLIYQLSSFLPSAVRMLSVQDASGRDLNPMPFEALSQTNLKWLTATADVPRNFIMAGRDLLIIYPGVRAAQTLTAYYANLTPALVALSDTTVLPNEDDDATLDLAELLLLLKNRDLSPVAEALTRFGERLNKLRSERR